MHSSFFVDPRAELKISQVRPGWDIPLNAVMTTLFFSTMLCLIIIGSTVAFNVIISIGQVGSVGSYIVAIACILHKRVKSESLLPSKFDLGRLGIPINVIALTFLSLAFVFPFFPLAPKPDAANMNWTVLITGFTMSVSLIYYFVKAKNTYLGPVEYVKQF